jgi:predicted metalloprotease with PDZ domain
VKAPGAPPYVVEVRARCDGAAVTGFSPDVEELEEFVTRGELTTPANGATELVYSVNLDLAATKFERFDVAARFGKSLVAGASSFLFTPMPRVDGVPVTVTFDEAKGLATGLRQAAGGANDAGGPNGYTVESHELRVATYTVFGAREVRKLDAPGTALRMALLDAPFALGAERMGRWIETAFGAVAAFYGQAPDSEVLVVVAPVPGERGVKFGRLLPESAPGIVLIVGEKTTERDLATDWMLTHELFHVGTPSYGAKSGWFDEGLATYFEPLIRARAGIHTEQAVWEEFASEMPRGLHALTKIGLSKGDARDDIYWGGGLFCLLADVEARRRTGGKLGLEDGLRAVLRAGGNSSVVWSLEETLAAMDQAIGEPVLGELAKRHLEGGAPVDFEKLLRELGVIVPRSAPGPGGKPRRAVGFDEKAPLAAVRRAIVRGKP